MSGGVDSSVAAALLKDQGYDVIGVTLNLAPELTDEAAVERDDACCTLAAVEDARRVADQLGIDHYCLNLRQLFAETVIADFVSEYRRGRTPNPCIRCNDAIKFEAVLRKGQALGAGLVATGHYARVSYNPVTDRHVLRKGTDPRKDQSYVLHVLTQSELAATRLPLGELDKPRTRELARRFGLRVAEKAESQDICFIDGDYREFLRSVAPAVLRPGAVLDLAGREIGQHRGIAFYTVGQRRGLGLATGEPLCVVEIDAERNALIVGPEQALYRDTVETEDANLIAVAEIREPMRVEAKLRYRMPPAPGWLSQPAPDKLLLRLDTPQRAITPGQSLVCYQGDSVVAGGRIGRAWGAAALSVGTATARSSESD